MLIPEPRYQQTRFGRRQTVADPKCDADTANKGVESRCFGSGRIVPAVTRDPTSTEGASTRIGGNLTQLAISKKSEPCKFALFIFEVKKPCQK